MKKFLSIVLLGLALLSFAACNDDKKTTQETAKKCESGKCSGDMNKKATEKKCSSDNKCGEGKCS